LENKRGMENHVKILEKHREGKYMNVHELTLKFIQVRNHTPEHANELLDFAKKAYVHNEISFSDYRILVRELELKGATNTPDKVPQTS
jgi:hypothetical protein